MEPELELELVYEGIRIDILEGLIISGITLFLFAVYYLYKKENRIIIWILDWFTRPPKAELKKDTKGRDWLIFIILLVLVVILGIKLVTFIVVVSDSMVPEFQRGDMILTQSINTTPEVGDIITFNVKDRKIAETHRVIELKNGLILTKGDNSIIPDSYGTMQKDIIAKAIQINKHPIVIKNLGALFITDYSKQGVIYKFGDRFTFLQQLSATIKVWGILITALALLAYVVLIIRS